MASAEHAHGSRNLLSSPGSNDRRTPEQIARESAMGEVSDVLLNLEHTIARSKKAIERSRTSGGNPNVERAEAQTFLNKLFRCYGSDRQAVGALFESFTASASFMDLHWPATVIVEMKAPGVSLQKAQDQRQRSWQESSDSANGIPAARWVVLGNVQQFEVWEPGRFPTEPRALFALDEIQRFTMQIVWCLFAGEIHHNPVNRAELTL